MAFYIMDMKENERICEIGNFVGYDDFDNKVYTGDIVGFYSMEKSDDGSMYPKICGSAIVIGKNSSARCIEIIIIEKNYNGDMEVLPKGVIKSYEYISYNGYIYDENSNYCINEIGRINWDNDTLEIIECNEKVIKVFTYDKFVYFKESISGDMQCVSISKEDIPEVVKFLQQLCDKENGNKISNNEVGD